MRNIIARSTSKNPALSYFLNLLKGALAGVAVTLISLLLYALLIKLFSISDSAIPAVNMIIKLGSIMAAVAVTLRKVTQKGFVAGGLAGILYVLLCFVFFVLFNGDFASARTLIIDLFTGAAAGVLSGMLFMNIKK